MFISFVKKVRFLRVWGLVTMSAKSNQRLRIVTVDPVLGRKALAEVMNVTPQTASRRLAQSAVRRSGLWPQQIDESGRIVVRASVVNKYLNSLPNMEDVTDRRQFFRSQ